MGLSRSKTSSRTFAIIPVFSLYGAAIATSTSQVLVAVSLLYFARETAGRTNWVFVLSGPVLATVAAAATMIWQRSLAGLAIGILAYVFVLVSFEYTRYAADLRFLSSRLLRK